VKHSGWWCRLKKIFVWPLYAFACRSEGGNLPTTAAGEGGALRAASADTTANQHSGNLVDMGHFSLEEYSFHKN